MSEHREDVSADAGDEAKPATDERLTDPEGNEPDSAASVRVVDRRWWARSEASDENEGAEGSSKPTFVAELEAQVEKMSRALEEKDALLKEYAAKYTSATREFR